MGKLQIHIETKNFNYLLALVIFIVILTTSCKAPRENPVDPNNSDKKQSSISGVVKTRGFPFTPISNVNVYWENDNIIVQTNLTGEYNIPNVLQKNGWLKFQSVGYSDDSTFINWDDNKVKTTETFLNSKPQIDSLEFFSIVENSYQSSKNSLIRIRARVSDFEGANDIVTVSLENDELSFLKVLTFDHTQNFYEGEFKLKDLNINSLNEIIGKDFKILVKDLEERDFVVGETNIKRIINEEVELISPLNNETVGELIKFNWIRYTPGYYFTYKIEIFTNDASRNLIYSEDNISSDAITHEITSEFEEGSYFWVIWAVDEFNNQGRSKPGSFIIGN